MFMKEIFLPPDVSIALQELYEEMTFEYDKVAAQVGQTCTGCNDNCCDSYFLHYTYIEWAYLWQGIRALDDALLDTINGRAKQYVVDSQKLIAEGTRPQLMCPCNENGLCMVYAHRLMICRMHGIPATLTRPDGQMLRFPGCWRCQEIVMDNYESEADAPAMDRTGLFHRLASLESRLLDDTRHLYPRVKISIAEMIVNGPPRVEKPFCER
jgi:hypothetical protein